MSKQKNGGTATAPIEAMWKAWDGRKTLPNHDYDGHPLLSEWSSYLVQLPYYMVHPFNSDADFQSLFNSHYQADKDYFSSSRNYAGERGRFGLGAGPTQKWCAGKGYKADQIKDKPDAQDCRVYSPYSIAGYMPTDPTEIKKTLLELLEDGESVSTFSLTDDGEDYHILMRRSLLNPDDWTGDEMVTLVDFSSEILGLSTIWLPEDFFQTYTNHFNQSNLFM